MFPLYVFIGFSFVYISRCKKIWSFHKSLLPRSLILKYWRQKKNLSNNKLLRSVCVNLFQWTVNVLSSFIIFSVSVEFENCRGVIIFSLVRLKFVGVRSMLLHVTAFIRPVWRVAVVWRASKIENICIYIRFYSTYWMLASYIRPISCQMSIIKKIEHHIGRYLN